jgi:hypothetical protein
MGTPMPEKKHASFLDFITSTMPAVPEQDLSHLPADTRIERQDDDGSRAYVATNDAGQQVIVGYVHGPNYQDELARLGIKGNLVRFRAAPSFNPKYTGTLCPPEFRAIWNVPIPEHLVGRTATLDTRRVRWLYKYQMTGIVTLHRPARGERRAHREPREKVEVPLVWLEGVAPPTKRGA